MLHRFQLSAWRLSQRQAGTGAQILFDYLLAEAGLKKDQLDLGVACHTELESVLTLLEGQADIAFGLQHFAAKYNLAFLPWLLNLLIFWSTGKWCLSLPFRPC